uniref:Retrotransposon gag domain-containing protein n=1 Tax=Brassica campestris TaxID=3711 RepID=M4DT08_BRACM
MFIPRFFYGGNCPETYLSWTANVETCIWHNHIPKNERLSLVASRLGGEARRWWEREEEKRWFHNRPAITTWEKLQNIMDKRYIPKDFPEAVKKQYGRRPTRKKVPSSASQLKLSKAISDSEGKANPPALASRRVPFCANKFFNAGLGFSLLILLWAVDRLGR